MRDADVMDLTDTNGPYFVCEDDEAWIRLANEVRTRRIALDLTQKDAYMIAGLGNVFWSKLEKNRVKPRIFQRSAVGIERALRWAPGSVAFILFDNGKPRELQPEERVGDLVDELQRNNELLADILERLSKVENSVQVLKPMETFIKGLRA